jgi:hypothetical protein
MTKQRSSADRLSQEVYVPMDDAVNRPNGAAQPERALSRAEPGAKMACTTYAARSERNRERGG